MYIEKAAEKMFVQKIRTFDVGEIDPKRVMYYLNAPNAYINGPSTMPKSGLVFLFVLKEQKR